MVPDLESLLATALRAADTAAEMIRTRRPISVLEKHDRDLVSDVDIAIEREVRQQLATATPDIGFLGEEEGRTGNPATSWVWTLDPVDGTSNFAHGIPLCAVSLALLRGSRAVVGVVDAPILGQRFHAAKGRGAFKGDERLSVSTVSHLRDAIVALGDYATGPRADRENELRLAVTTMLAPRVHRMRMLGSAALDLAWVAAGYLDGSVILDNNPWDTAAGALIAREAGANVADASGIPHSLKSAVTIAAAPSLFDSLTAVIRAAGVSDARRQDMPVDDVSSYAPVDGALRDGRRLIFDLDDLAPASLIETTAPRASLNRLEASKDLPEDADGEILPEIRARIAAVDAGVVEPVGGEGNGGQVNAAPPAFMHETIAACRDSGRTSVLVSRRSAKAIGAWLARHGLDDLIGRVLTADDCLPGRLQPDGNLIGQAVAALGGHPEQCALITASVTQIKIARGLGIRCIGYAHSSAYVQDLRLAGAECVVPSLADLTLRLRARPSVSTAVRPAIWS